MDDSILNCPKTLADPEKISKSLMNLRDELNRSYPHIDATSIVLLYKINSCLYSEYPKES